MNAAQARAYEQITSGNAAAFRSSYAWQAAAKAAKYRQHFECQSCKQRGLYVPAEEVHHVVPIEVAPERALDPSNLMCLCRSCHRLTHGRSEPLTPERW